MAELKLVGKTLGNYQIVAEIGRGGMAVCFPVLLWCPRVPDFRLRLTSTPWSDLPRDDFPDHIGPGPLLYEIRFFRRTPSGH